MTFNFLFLKTFSDSIDNLLAIKPTFKWYTKNNAKKGRQSKSSILCLIKKIPENKAVIFEKKRLNKISFSSV